MIGLKIMCFLHCIVTLSNSSNHVRQNPFKANGEMSDSTVPIQCVH